MLNCRNIIILIFFMLACVRGQSDYTQTLTNCGKSCPNGYYFDNTACVPYKQSKCPFNYIQVDHFCYARNDVLANPCPASYQLVNNVCYPPCQVSNPWPTYPSSTASPTLPPQANIMTTQSTTIRCPAGAVYYNGRCSRVLCAMGEYYNGRCLQPACREGLVWRNKRCQPPGFVTTILDIENVFINEANHRIHQDTPININQIEYHTQNPKTQSALESTTHRNVPAMIQHLITPTPSISIRSSTVRQQFNEDGCCTVLFPRICRQYTEKWICHNRRTTRCNPRVCDKPLVYLKAPQVVNEPPLLVIPPNPVLDECEDNDCDGHNTIDCSGCVYQNRRQCSPYCYRTACPSDRCAFIDLQKYCEMYPGDLGCTKLDGCIWSWCSNAGGNQENET